MLATAMKDSLVERSIRSSREPIVRREVSMELSTVASWPEICPSSSVEL